MTKSNEKADVSPLVPAVSANSKPSLAAVIAVMAYLGLRCGALSGMIT